MFENGLETQMDARTEQQKTSVEETSKEEHGERLFVSPKDFYEEMNKRPDIREILAKLAKR